MIEPREACLALEGVHELLNAAKLKPARVVVLPGARVQMRVGHDAAYPSTNANRVMIYDPGAADLCATMKRAGEEFAAAGIRHWFAKIGPGVEVGQVLAAMRESGARVWPDVRYPALVRRAEVMARPATTLDVRRVGAEEIAAHRGELAQFLDATGIETFLKAASRPRFAHVMGFEGGRAVAAGMLGIAGRSGYVCFGGTHPEFRGRGGQSVMIAERVSIAHERGCEWCLCETVSFLSTSLNNLMRAGFERVFEWMVLEVGKGQ